MKRRKKQTEGKLSLIRLTCETKSNNLTCTLRVLGKRGREDTGKELNNSPKFPKLLKINAKEKTLKIELRRGELT